jgi:hypothetical protein
MSNQEQNTSISKQNLFILTQPRKPRGKASTPLVSNWVVHHNYIMALALQIVCTSAGHTRFYSNYKGRNYNCTRFF